MKNIILKKISYYLPDLGQSWLIVLVFIVGGTIFAGAISTPFILLIPNFEDWSSPIIYPLSFVPAVCFVYFMIKNSRQKAAVLIYKTKYLSGKTSKSETQTHQADAQTSRHTDKYRNNHTETTIQKQTHTDTQTNRQASIHADTQINTQTETDNPASMSGETLSTTTSPAYTDQVSTPENNPAIIPTTIEEVMQIIPDSEIDASLPSIPLNKPNFGKLGAILSFILLIPLTLSVSVVTEPIMSWWEMPDFIKKIFENLMGGHIIATALTVAIMAPLLEEWMCRGVIMRGLLYHSGPLKAILWSALIFGAMHLHPWQAVPAFFAGIAIGWVYWRTRSIWAPIFMHFVNNGTSILLTVLYPDLPVDAALKDLIPGNQYYMIYITAIIVLSVIITLMHKKYDKPVIPYKIQSDI